MLETRIVVSCFGLTYTDEDYHSDKRLPVEIAVIHAH